jgi:hypothetical protein
VPVRTTVPEIDAVWLLSVGEVEGADVFLGAECDRAENEGQDKGK